MRPDTPARAAWLAWHRIESVYTRRYFGLLVLCVKPRDPAYDARFAIQPGGGREVKLGMRIVAFWRARTLATNVFVPLSHMNQPRGAVIDRLRDLAGDHCPIR